MSPKLDLEVRRNNGARSYSPRSNLRSSSRWIGPTSVSWWQFSKRGPPRVKGFNRQSPGTSMVPETEKLWMPGLRKWKIIYMPPRLAGIPSWSLLNPTWKAMPPHGDRRWDKRRGRTMAILGSSLRNALSRSLFQGTPTTSRGANFGTLWMPQMRTWGNTWGVIPNSCWSFGTCTNWIVCANLWWGFQLGPSENLRRVGPPHYSRPSRKWRTSRMWGGVTNLGSRRTTNSFTRNQGMRGNETGGKVAQPRIIPNHFKTRGSNQKGVLWRRGSFQREPTQGRFWSKTQRSMFQLQWSGALLQRLSQVQTGEWEL